MGMTPMMRPPMPSPMMGGAPPAPPQAGGMGQVGAAMRQVEAALRQVLPTLPPQLIAQLKPLTDALIALEQAVGQGGGPQGAQPPAPPPQPQGPSPEMLRSLLSQGGPPGGAPPQMPGRPY